MSKYDVPAKSQVLANFCVLAAVCAIRALFSGSRTRRKRVFFGIMKRVSLKTRDTGISST